LECGIIVRGILEGTMSRKVGLIWEIPAQNDMNVHFVSPYYTPSTGTVAMP
jgi:hypothetical protein